MPNRKPSDELFKLIHSLTKMEKRYIKLNANLQEGEKNYLLLFDVIEKMKSYDESIVRQKLAGKKFLRTLHVTKKYLYDFILNALAGFLVGKTNESEIKRLLLFSDILKSRGLYKESARRLNKAKNLAQKYEKHLLLLEIINREIRKALNDQLKEMQKVVDQLYQEMSQVQNNLNTELEYQYILHQLFILLRTQNRVRDEKEKTFIKQLIDKPLMKQPKLATTFLAKVNLAYTNAIIERLYHKSGNLELINELFKKVVSIWDAYPFMKREYAKTYKLHIYNYLNTCHKAKRFDAFHLLLNEAKSLPSQNFEEKMEDFQNYYYVLLLYYLNTNNIQEANILVNKFEKELDLYQRAMNKAREIAFYYNITILFFIQSDFQQASYWLNKIVQHPKTEQRQDMQRFARIFNLIILFDLKQYQLFENFYATTYRTLKRKSKLSQFEIIVFQHLKKLLNIKSSKEQKTLFQVFENALIRFMNNQSQQLPLATEELMLWVKSKISGTKIIDLF